MTSYLIDYFVKYAKFDSKNNNYYFDNLKSIFTYHDEDYNTYMNKFKRNQFTYEAEKTKYETKRIIDEYTVNDIINLFNFFQHQHIIYNELYKIKFLDYILYILEKIETETSHQQNRYIKYKKYKQWFELYDMNYKIINTCVNVRMDNIYKNIVREIDSKIKNDIFEYIDNNEDILKNFIGHLNDNSKQILIDQMILYYKDDVIKKASEKINKNEIVKKLSINVIKESKEQLDEYLKSDSVVEKYNKSVDDYINYRDYMSKKCESYVNQNITNLNLRLNNISKTIKELKLQYINKSENDKSESSVLSNEVSESENDKSENNESNSSESTESNESETNESDDNLDIDNCFVKHGKKFNLRLNELMKLSKYDNVKQFKKYLIDNKVIKKEFDLQGSTYRLTEEQKIQFNIDFKKSMNN